MKVEFDGYEDVYNMEVENHHNFAVDGGFVNDHNVLGAHQGAQLAALAAVGIKCYLGTHRLLLYPVVIPTAFSF